MTFPHQLFDMSGKVTAITGGARGIGAQTARTLAAAGSAIAVLDVLTEPGEKLVAEINESGGRAAFWKMDVTQEENVQRVFGEIATRFGRLDALVNNAGIEGANLPTHEMTLQQWQKVIDVNVTGVFLCTKYAIPHMLTAGGGSIVNLSSMYGLVGGPDVPAYHASKGAVRLMAKTEAMLYAAQNIRANSVHPGFIRTPLLEEAFEKLGDPEQIFAHMKTLVPLAKIGDPQDIAAGILYLVSPAGRYVTGTELVIDGGYTAR
ncbi:SDR family NAD(P)-dependent oxidoreductase [Paraburkholderia fungorum]|jgi:NAD(P)-dependent dehydrogenase (short-subunit alcohol dehydrogenase family)|uniref:Glucose 1-dehydrogenase n=1 Tax=Paraburkholderia fungorum TaxID=134537 RepID=A0AAJ3SEX7_9BURK|nr:glucose 1-dehydrogenase [Paraburkholderia fungorum]KFX66764.1 short-chain dehydrogenase [Burkholderia sp. K24]AJZ63200.1 short chain dehydrogenase family protein [Paraburkholderia fungorum]MBB4512017.1 NAD(P)-dependent dehydrogenase (short-subunit alcohol dehydrogenase family) [Paraburkholderia fungorum]MBB5540367.1 NAD(P)-dependent dehydrogenase (short-subunit alcohol dehydrogenase family) [Paraburkholderia fungorum]MBB6199923.1 NAD(P)-dependent dehydrogenase (short-subunit alcohol dehydro